MIYAALTLSVLLNTILIWFGYKLVKKSLSYSENMYILLDDMDGFVSHLGAIYELATFYGDETLQNLLLHSKRLKGDIEEFKQNHTIEIEGEEGTLEDGTTEDTGEEEEAQEGP